MFSDRFCGPGYMLVGDAACFLDPLLSTGVHLAQYSAMIAAASIISAIKGEVSEHEAWTSSSVYIAAPTRGCLCLFPACMSAIRARRLFLECAEAGT